MKAWGCHGQRKAVALVLYLCLLVTATRAPWIGWLKRWRAWRQRRDVSGVQWGWRQRQWQCSVTVAVMILMGDCGGDDLL